MKYAATILTLALTSLFHTPAGAQSDEWWHDVIVTTNKCVYQQGNNADVVSIRVLNKTGKTISLGRNPAKWLANPETGDMELAYVSGIKPYLTILDNGSGAILLQLPLAVVPSVTELTYSWNKCAGSRVMPCGSYEIRVGPFLSSLVDPGFTRRQIVAVTADGHFSNRNPFPLITGSSWTLQEIGGTARKTLSVGASRPIGRWTVFTIQHDGIFPRCTMQPGAYEYGSPEVMYQEAFNGCIPTSGSRGLYRYQGQGTDGLAYWGSLFLFNTGFTGDGRTPMFFQHMDFFWPDMARHWDHARTAGAVTGTIHTPAGSFIQLSRDRYYHSSDPFNPAPVGPDDLVSVTCAAEIGLVEFKRNEGGVTKVYRLTSATLQGPGANGPQFYRIGQ